MRNIKPPKAGDPLSAGMFNTLAETNHKLARPSANGINLHVGSFQGTARRPAFRQEQLVVASVINQDEKLYSVQVRSYVNGWTTDTSAAYYLDAKDSQASFNIGDKLTGYWHEQRGMFLPVSGGAGKQQSDPSDLKINIAYEANYHQFDADYDLLQSEFIDLVYEDPAVTYENTKVRASFNKLFGPDIGVDLQAGNSLAPFLFTEPGIYSIEADCILHALRDVISGGFIEPADLEEVHLSIYTSADNRSFNGSGLILEEFFDIHWGGEGSGPIAGVDSAGTLTLYKQRKSQGVIYFNVPIGTTTTDPFTPDFIIEMNEGPSANPPYDGHGVRIHDLVFYISKLDVNPSPSI